MYSRLSLGGCDVGVVSAGRMASSRRCCYLEQDGVGSPNSAAWTAAPPPIPSLTAQLQMMETGLQRAAGGEGTYIYLQTEAGMSI